MVVFLNGKPDVKSYRRFKIRRVEGVDDFGMMKEVLARRLKHKEWPTPDLIVLDGGIGHLNKIEALLKKLKRPIPLLAVSKGPKRNKLDFHTRNQTVIQSKEEIESTIEKVRNEAHRFAIDYHKRLRNKNWISN